MNNNLNLIPGDIVLYRGTRTISKIILKFLNAYRKRVGLEIRELYSHTGTIVNIWDTIYIGEAQAEGFILRPFMKAYGDKLDRIKVITPKRKYSKVEQTIISKLASELSFSPTRYDYFSLLSQAWYTLTGKWIGIKGKKAERRMYCTEATATLANLVRPKTFDKAYATNPIDIITNKYYKEKENANQL